jgi:hypothetical protein
MISLNYHAEISNEVLGQRAEVEKYSDRFFDCTDGCGCKPDCE